MKKISSIKFAGKVSGIKTLADGGVHAAFLIDREDGIADCIARLIEYRQSESSLVISITEKPVKKNKEVNAKKENDKGGTPRKRRRYPYRS